jgi:hypothetical protein
MISTADYVLIADLFERAYPTALAPIYSTEAIVNVSNPGKLSSPAYAVSLIILLDGIPDAELLKLTSAPPPPPHPKM